jgi:FkbM family methyltransferase
MKAETIFALTSLSPAPWRAARQRTCIASWKNAGLRVCSVNHPSEMAALSSLYDVNLLPVTQTSKDVFGSSFVPVSAALKWAADLDAAVLLINSDIELRLTPWEMKRIRWLAECGLCYFVRYNQSGDFGPAAREPFGIDAFLLHGRDAGLVPDSFLSIGQPFWDYLLPHLFAERDRRIYSVDFPVAFHRDHPRQWSWENWLRCALEFERITGTRTDDCSFEGCVNRSVRVREAFDRKKQSLSPQPMQIRDWVERRFRNAERKTFLELGSHCGTDTAWMAALTNVTIHAFEPDPRNHQPVRPNVIQQRVAIADRNGRGPFVLSHQGWGQEWTHSSSIKKPANHLVRYPVTFGATIDVETLTLDTYCRREGLGIIDFIWADIQGAEGEMIRGAGETLARTRYLYTEYSDDELYEGQVTLRDMVTMLPHFRVIEVWADDVLFENSKLSP